MKTKMSFPNEIEEIKAQIKVLQSKLSFLEELEKTKSPVEEAYKDWWGQYPETGTWDSFDDKRWQGFQAGYEFAYAISTAKEVMEKVQEEQEDNEWKSVALRFGEKLSGYLSDGYYELSPAAWFRWAVFNYGKGQHIKDAVRESKKWCEENPEKSVEDYLTPQERGDRIHKEVENEIEKLQEKNWYVDTKTNLKPHWEPKPQTPEQTAQSLKEAFVKAQQTENWKETQKLIDEEDNDKNFKNSLDLIKEWGEKNKPPTLKELLWEWCNSDWGDQSGDVIIDDLIDLIDDQFIPPSHDTNDYQWNKCLKIMREKLR